MNTSFSLKQTCKKIIRKTASWNMQRIAIVFGILALVTGLAGAYFWYTRSYMTDERRFWAAIDNGMVTSSVTQTMTDWQDGSKIEQKQQFFFSPQAVSRSSVVYSVNTALIDTEVRTEGVAFLDAQYSRYTKFHTNQAKADGMKPSLDDILNKWSVSESSDIAKSQIRNTYMGQLVVPAIFGQFSSSFRQEVIDTFKQKETYKIQEDGMYTDVVDGKRLLYVSTKLELRSFAEQLQRAFLASGYGESALLKSIIDSSQGASEANDVSVQFIIDTRNNTIIGMNYGDREEVYSGYGIQQEIEAPDYEFTSKELAQKVEERLRGVRGF